MANDTNKQLADQERRIRELENIIKRFSFFGDQTTYTQSFDAIKAKKVSLFNRDTAPAQGEVGDLVVISGKLRICTDSTVPTWTIVGNQS